MTDHQPNPTEGYLHHIGTRLRDAAVDPRPGDHLTPIGAGRAGPAGNPHGPHVVSPRLDGTAPPAASHPDDQQEPQP